ncbi:P-loop containing nucleoside triphosphate hydrolase protein [Mycena amicta]|nr:P-loop containing nucleoside triphosphate hydrolase protein [Mycena amicta]
MPGTSSTTLMDARALDRDAWSIAVVGAPGVGKTRFISSVRFPRICVLAHSQIFISLFSKILKDELESSEMKQTFSRKLTIDDQTTIVTLLDIYKLHLGTEDEDQNLLRDADAFILIYSVTSPYSLQDAVAYLRAIRRATAHDPVLTLVANQTDRAAQDQEVSHAEGVALAQEFDCPFAESSAKTGLGVDAIVMDLVRVLRSRKKGKGPADSKLRSVWGLISRR